LITATTGTMTYRRMNQLAKDDPAIAERLELFDHRVLEELYDIENDPDCLVNLVGKSQHAETHRRLREKLVGELERIDDPLAEVAATPSDDALVSKYMAAEDECTEMARAARKKRRRDQR